MAAQEQRTPGLWPAFLTGLCLIAFGCGCQAAFAPTVRVTCPARTASAPDCHLQWLVAFDMIPVRHTSLPALQPVGEIVPTSPNSRRGNASTLYLNTSAGPVRTIMWGDQLSLQDLRDPLRRYVDDPHAPALDVTMWPSRWSPEGNGVVRKPHPIRLIANAAVAIGLLFWISVFVQMLRRPFIAGAVIAFSLLPSAAGARQRQSAATLPDSVAAHLKSERLEIVTSIRGLPLGVRDELQSLFGAQTLDIAEPGAEFQVTDVIAKPNLPIRRLIAAGCSIDHCLVYYERGGIAHRWYVVLFQWRPQQTRFEWGGTAPGDLVTIDKVKAAVLSGAIKGANQFW